MPQKIKQPSQSNYGFSSPLSKQNPIPVQANRAPATSDTGFDLGQLWIYNSAIYGLAAVSAGSATWELLGSSTGSLSTLGSDSGTATPVASNINILGGTNIGTTATSDDVTVNLDASLMGLTAVNALTFDTDVAAAGVTLSGTTLAADGTDGNITLTLTPKGTGGVTVTSGTITATNGSLSLGTAGNKINVATGANASIGTSSAMVAGSTTINTTAVTANSLIFLTAKTPGGTQGELSVGTITPATSFVINSSSNTDTSTVQWWIVN